MTATAQFSVTDASNATKQLDAAMSLFEIPYIFAANAALRGESVEVIEYCNLSDTEVDCIRPCGYRGGSIPVMCRLEAKDSLLPWFSATSALPNIL